MRYLFSILSSLDHAKYHKKLHAHPHWQLEIIHSGNPLLHLKEKSIQLKKGDMVFIPPEIYHVFEYYNEFSSWSSVRYSMDDIYRDEIDIVSDKESKRMSSLLVNILKKKEEDHEPDLSKVIESFLEGIMYYVYRNHSTEEISVGIINKVNEFISSVHNRTISIKDVANHVGYSESHMRAMYKKLTGTSLKKSISKSRFNLAESYLQHTDYRINEIANMLGFTDIYSFSRFIKKNCGSSPSQLRKDYLLK